MISSVATIGISLVAGATYIVDLDRNPVESCTKMMSCTDEHYITVGVSRSAPSDETGGAQTCQLNGQKSYELIKFATTGFWLMWRKERTVRFC